MTMHSRETYPSTNSNWKSAVKSGLKKNFTPGVDFYFKKKGFTTIWTYLRCFVCVLAIFCMYTYDVLHVYLRCFICVLTMFCMCTCNAGVFWSSNSHYSHLRVQGENRSRDCFTVKGTEVTTLVISKPCLWFTYLDLPYLRFYILDRSILAISSFILVILHTWPYHTCDF